MAAIAGQASALHAGAEEEEMSDYIRKAVELADGWRLGVELLQTPSGNVVLLDDAIPQVYLDALAAQLVRQVDEVSPHYNIFHIKWTNGKQDPRTELHGLPGPVSSFTKLLKRVDGPDRTMNTIKAIVDSKVLEGKK